MDDADRAHRIRQRAYEIWQEAGCPSDLALDHWLEAERSVELEADRSLELDSGDTPATEADRDGEAPETIVPHLIGGEPHPSI